MHVHSPEWIAEHLCLALDGPSRSRWGTACLTLGARRQQGLNAAVPPTTYLVPVGLRSSRSTKTRIRAPPVVRSWRHTTPLDPTISRLRRVLQPHHMPAEVCDILSDQPKLYPITSFVDCKPWTKRKCGGALAASCLPPFPGLATSWLLQHRLVCFSSADVQLMHSVARTAAARIAGRRLLRVWWRFNPLPSPIK